jgi:hypothetical protein
MQFGEFFGGCGEMVFLLGFYGNLGAERGVLVV